MSALLLLFLLQAAPETANANPEWIQHAEAPRRTLFADFIGLPGKVSLTCDLPVSGLLENCKIASAIPQGAGYEELTLEAARTARLSPKLVDGQPTPTTIKFSMNYPAPPPFPPYKGAAPSEETVVLARPIAESILRSQGSGKIVADVAADRQVLVQSWLDELLPSDPEADMRRVSLQLARTLTVEQIRNILAGRPPGGTIPDFTTLNAAQDPDPRLAAASAQLRQRYCAQFDCRSPFEKTSP